MGRSFARRGAGLAALAAALALILPGLAGAASLTLAGSTVTYQASPGELNALTININGSDEYVFTDTVSIGNSGCTVVSATTVTCPNTSVSAIIVNLGDLADSASLRAIDDVTVVSGNAGDDSISISDSMRVNRIKAVVDVNGNAGSDTLTIDNSADPAQNSFTVSPTSVGAGPFDFLFGTGGSVTFDATLESLNVLSGQTPDTVAVTGTAAGTATSIDTGGGDDLLQVSSDGVTTSGHLDGLLGPLTLIGGPGANTLSIVDQDSWAGNTATVTATSISGIAPAAISYTASGGFGGGIQIRGSNHADSFSIQSTPVGATLDLRTLGGDDTVNVSSDGTGATGDLAAIGGELIIDLGSGSNALALSDAAEATPGANAAVQITAGSITGLAGQSGASAITYRATGGNLAGGLTVTGSTSAGVAEGYTVSDPAGPFTLLMGAGNDAVVLRSSAFATTIAAGAGDDTLAIGDASGSLEGFRAPISADGGPGADALALTDSGDGSADIVMFTSNQIGASVGSSLFGPGGSVTYSNWSSVSLTTGSGSDVITVAGTATGTAVSVVGGPGNDVITLGDSAGSLESIVGPVTIDGGIGFNSLTIDDSSDESGDSAALTSDQLGAEEGDDLFGPGGSLSYSGFTLLSLTAGSGPDTIHISGTPTALVMLGAGDDLVFVEDSAVLAGTIEGGPGIDTLSYEAVTGPVTASLGTGNATGTNGIVSFETLIGGPGKDNLTGQNSAGSTLIGGPGNDTLTGGTGNDVLDGGAGNDQLNGSQGDDSYVFTKGGSDQVIDPKGRDELDFSRAPGKVVINLSKSKSQRQRLRKGGAWLRLSGRIENVVGSRFNDRITGSRTKNVLLGKGGNDRITGLAGNDTLNGGGGKDKLIEAADVNFTLTRNRLRGLGKDKVKAFESASLTGGDGHNVISTKKFRGRVVLRGGPGNDTLVGGRKADLLIGGDGDDTLMGGNGKDRYVAGPGNDTLLMKDRTPDRADGGDGFDRAAPDTADLLTNVEALTSR